MNALPHIPRRDGRGPPPKLCHSTLVSSPTPRPLIIFYLSLCPPQSSYPHILRSCYPDILSSASDSRPSFGLTVDHFRGRRPRLPLPGAQGLTRPRHHHLGGVRRPKVWGTYDRSIKGCFSKALAGLMKYQYSTSQGAITSKPEPAGHVQAPHAPYLIHTWARCEFPSANSLVPGRRRSMIAVPENRRKCASVQPPLL